MTSGFKTTSLLAGGLFLTLTLTALAGRLAANQAQQQTEFLLLTQQVGDGIALVAAESRGLLQDSQALALMQRANDRNIAHFQLLAHGSVKRDLPALEDFSGESIEPVANHFAEFQSTVSGLIQSRSQLDRALQGRDSQIQGAQRLASQAESLADGLEQHSRDNAHLRAGMRVKAALGLHSLQVKQAYWEGSGAPALPLEMLAEDLAALSTAASAPASPAIRRSAANLLAQINEHAQQLGSLEEYRKVAARLQTMQATLLTQTQQLQQALDTLSMHLYSHPLYAIHATILLGLMTLGLGSLLGYALKPALAPPLASNADAPAPPAQQDRTTPGALSQFKTEKNLLMNDIKPIGDGILYIKADEHLESTGDLARCLNQSREALLRRIDNLKRQVAELQDALLQPVAPMPADMSGKTEDKSVTHSVLIDLTFKGHAELDGLQRRLKGLSGLEQEEARQLLMRCLRAERVLDEIRVRLKKADTQVDTQSNPQAVQPSTSARPPLDKIHQLVERLADNLDEIQTQSTKSRRSRVATP